VDTEQHQIIYLSLPTVPLLIFQRKAGDYPSGALFIKKLLAFTQSSNLRGRFRTIDLLIEVACLAKKEIHVFNIKIS